MPLAEAASVWLLLVAPLASAIELPSTPPALPDNGYQWLNSSPLTYEDAQGKGIVFWYYEESCPVCASKWPGIMESVEEHAEDPVLFVGVISGRSRADVRSYVRKNKVDWPVIVDEDRSFEAASGDVSINLNSIVDVRVVQPDGSYTWGWWNDIPKTVEHAAKGAAWKFEHDRFPEEFRPVVRRLEFGDYLSAAPAIRSGLKSDSKGLKKTAGYMQQFVEHKMRASIARQTRPLSETDDYGRYLALESVSNRFAPHKLPQAEAEQLEKLQKLPAVASEVTARKVVDAAQPLLSNPDPRKQAKAVTRLRRVIDRHPNTRAAADAEALIARSRPAPGK
ncbi:MAG: redoxin domain-containing protein [Planctomycetota bacterium]